MMMMMKVIKIQTHKYNQLAGLIIFHNYLTY